VSGAFAVYQKPHFGRASAFAFDHISLQKSAGSDYWRRSGCRSATLLKINWRQWKPGIPSNSFACGRVSRCMRQGTALQ
jgi:hypothetical protein